ncbi:MAG: hypothetical protein ACRDRR_13835 [Pseudonocardiaceae bacterium]
MDTDLDTLAVALDVRTDDDWVIDSTAVECVRSRMRGRWQQRIPILDLPLPTPTPEGAVDQGITPLAEMSEDDERCEPVA